MPYTLYTGQRIPPLKREDLDLPPSPESFLEDPSRYRPDKGLVEAVNVALLLRQPLLVTGEAGTGKTQLAAHIAWELGLGKPLKFETKSTSVARDLFYTYDTMGRFHAAQTKEGSQNSLDYLTYNALGKAILLAKPRTELEGILAKDFEYDGPRPSVVLVDEVDKAPRDFPNDILNELREMYFRIPELGNREVRVSDPDLRPIVIFTSNSEKHLPDAFLRRCVYYHIPFPDNDPDRLETIVSARLSSDIPLEKKALREALDFFLHLRKEGRLRKKPATAELLDWLVGIARWPEADGRPAERRRRWENALFALVKTKEDVEKATALLNNWLDNTAE